MTSNSADAERGKADKKLMTDKKRIRRIALTARRTMSPKEREDASKAITDLIAASDVFRMAETVLIYKAMPDEVDLGLLTDLPDAEGKRFCYPRVTGEGNMTALLPCGPDSWEKGSFGITEPDESKSLPVCPEEIDLVLCPCTAFDNSMGRLGMGGGYYDRFLPKCVNAAIAAVAFESQKVAAVPKEDTDVQMDMVFTEKEVYGKGKTEQKNSMDQK